MQFSEKWLRSLCNPAIDSDALCHLLTMAGLEVEEVEPVAPAFSGVVVAQVVSFEKHPDADKLKVCRVDVGQGEPLQIVCGAPNVVIGMKAPCAMVGANLPGFAIKAAKLRGVESFGMMCSAEELGMTQDHDGLLVLPDDAPVGADIRDYLALDDRKITIKLTPNRADCLSLAGVARELAALTDTPLTLPATPAVAPVHDAVRPVRLDAPEACPRYAGRIVRNVNAAAATPEWMRQRLLRCGVRSISAVVDITNYVMLELGQPMHAFDNDKLAGDIHVRMPRAGDSLELLNGQTVEPTAGSLLIADEARLLALAGVMGGEQSGVTNATRNVFLESAFFQPDAIVGRARALGFSSDASHRFERGVDFALAQIAMERATALLVEICGGEPGPVQVAEVADKVPVRQAVAFRPARARQVLGIEVADAAMQAGFERLGMSVKGDGAQMWVTAPSYRFDIAIEEDLIEEVARIVGYDNIPPVAPQAGIRMLPLPEASQSPSRVRRTVAARGYQEVITYAFVEEVWERDFAGNTEPVRLANPIASHLAVMRSSLIGGLVGTLASNQRHRADRVRLFEIGRCFVRNAAAVPVAGYEQPVRLAGLAWGPVAHEQWGQASRKVDFYDVKADVEHLLGDGASFEAAVHPALHPGRSARVSLGGKTVGFVGELHPAWVQKYDLGTAPIVFELELDAVLARQVPQYSEIARLPAVTRDIALVLNSDIPAARLLAVLKGASAEIVRSIEVFDVYSGKGLEPETRSIALRVVLQHTERTLEEQEIDQAVQALITAAGEQLGGQLRA
ncbi:phenylalanine--tRNA ligase subunit beta [Viridibacterium curvum]|uniref:Phenylalanine--tRNA ligase beta subunit n=1 Tax=Viridibacterium curvum TaxID=1101404 RepID=A0ABP9R0W0_9RHOO